MKHYAYYEGFEKDLLTATASVRFIKKDGSAREMLCTRIADLIPAKPVTESAEVKPAKTRVANPNNIAVYDLDKNAWRTIRKNTITEIELFARKKVDLRVL